MRRSSYAIILITVAASSYLVGRWSGVKSPNTVAGAGSPSVLYYVDPMHPAYTSDKPGIAPDCGMQLEPVYAEIGAPSPSPGTSPSTLPAGTVQVSAERQQIMGVRLAVAEETSGSHELRTVGRVSAEENRTYRLLTTSDGWIRDVQGGTTGSVVHKDEVLATLYNREALNAQQALFYALNAIDRFKKTGLDSPEQIVASNSQRRAAEDNLRALGMGEIQIQAITQSRKPVGEIEVRAPVTSLVAQRSAFPGLRFDRGLELYRLVDLSQVWIMADLFENEAQYFRPGTNARVTLPHQNRVFTSRVSDVPPQFDPTTRTLKVRLQADNPGFVLRPDMFVDVALPVRLPVGLSVPVDSVLDSGSRKRVFVERGNGYFEPRDVVTGWRSGDRIEIVKGLVAGERIVVSGNFLIDSESRMKTAAAGIDGASTKDPVCGMDIDEDKAKAAGRVSEYRGATYYFCSDLCKVKFDRNAEQYRNQGSGNAGQRSANSHQHRTAIDPACGMKVDISTPATIREEYGGTTYYFCSSFCRDNFLKAPATYLKAGQGQKTGTPVSRGAPTQVVEFGRETVR